MNTEVRETIVRVIQEVAGQHKLSLPAIKEEHAVVDDLGFASLQVATLIANLEEAIDVDPFESEDVMITDVRTVGDLCRVYADCLFRSTA
jgi:acyl carrier protein